jgi:hypothetical protein
MPQTVPTSAEAIAALGVERRVGISDGDYLDLFLKAEDLEPRMNLMQDSRLQGPDPADVWFPKHQGILTGMSIWLGSTGEPVWRLVDIRTVFPTEYTASAWHAEAMAYNSEGMPHVDGAPPVGQECCVFGGTNPSPLDPRVMLTAFFYLFRHGRVVVKLFVMQGVEAGTPLTPARVAEIARRIDDRISRVQRRRQSG